MLKSKKSKKEYLSLSPRDDLNDKKSPNYNEDYKHYKNKMLWALNNRKEENINNIAITGYYGSGKSSILKTFIKEQNSKPYSQKKYKFLELSLATFHNKEGNEGEQVKEIEQSLLQQIFYNVNDDKIPNSRYKKVSNKITFNFFEQGLLVFIFIVILIRFYNLIFKISPVFGFQWLDILLVISVLFLFLLKVNVINQLRFKRVSFKNLAIEMEEKSGEFSILSHFLDEIIYFFKETKYNVVVIEDIDRFDNSEIFSNLRELNLILNNTELIDEQVVFIYAIKNDQFKSASDRTKFFDFIIPIVPIVNYETSSNLFLKNLDDNIDSIMVNDLISLIDDVRIINNIANELKTFLSILNIDSLEKDSNNLVNKLLPLLFYKNVEPHDFSNLLKKKGYLFEIFKNEEKIRNDKILSFNKRIEDIENEINLIQNQNFKSINEFKSLVVAYLVKYAIQNFFTRYQINSISILNDEDIYEEVLTSSESLNSFNNIFKANTYSIRINNSSSHTRNIQKDKLENQIGFNIEERLKSIKGEDVINIKETKITDLKNEIDIIDKKAINEILDKNYIENLLSNFDKGRNNQSKPFKPNIEIITTLVLHGYIDKDYFLYLSNYNDLNLSFKDHRFLINVKNNFFTSFGQKLVEPSKILERLATSDYNSSSILNFDFVNYVFKDNSRLKLKQRLLIIDQINKFETNEIEFLKVYFEECINVGLFMNLLCKKSSNLWQVISEDKGFESSLADKYFEAIMQSANISDLKKFSYHSNFKDYINRHNDIIELISNTSRTISIIQELQLVLDNINFNSNSIILDFIYENNCYSICPNNIYGFYKRIVSVSDNKLETNILTLISKNKSQLEKMYNYIMSEKRVLTFVSELILDVETNTEESEETLINLLNKDVLPIDAKNEVIIKQNTIITDITQINEREVKVICLKQNKVDASWGNLIDLNAHNKQDSQKKDLKSNEFFIEDYVIEFINQNIDQLVKKIEEVDDDKIYPYIKQITIHKRLSDNSLFKILENYNFNEVFTKEIFQLEKNKLLLLIDNSYFELSNENLDFLLENKRIGLSVRLIEALAKIDLSNLDRIELKTEILFEALKTKNNRIREKLIIDFLKNRDVDSFKSFGLGIIDVIAKIYLKENLFLDADLSKKLRHAELDVSNAVKLLNRIIETLSIEEIKEYLLSINNEKFQELALPNKWPRIFNNKENLKLVEKLKEKNIINDYKIKDRKYISTTKSKINK